MKSQLVYVYRNLKYGRKAKPLYSVMRNGRVISHRRRLILLDVTFKVRETGRKRVLKEKRKNVHAFAVGTLVGAAGAFGQACNGGDYPVRIHYDPYKSGNFTDDDGKAIKSAWGVIFNENGMSGTYIDYKR